jgi:hypothetical protein
MISLKDIDLFRQFVVIVDSRVSVLLESMRRLVFFIFEISAQLIIFLPNSSQLDSQTVYFLLFGCYQLL